MSEFHKHLLIDAEVNISPTDTNALEAWKLEIVKAIDMELFIPPIARYCSDPDNEGASSVCFITTSHLTAHFWLNNGKPFVKADIYSCKEYDPYIVIDFFKRFEPTKLHYTIIDRSYQPHKISQQGYIEYGENFNYAGKD